MLGQKENRVFLNIAEGKIVKRVNQRVEVFDYLEGDLEKIYKKDREFRGEKVPYYYLDIKDPDSGELYSLGIGASSGVWRSIILSLASVETFLLPIKIDPYRKGDYDRVSVYSGGKRLDWISDLPPVELVEVQGQTIKSTAKRDQYISELVEKVNAKIGVQEAPKITEKAPIRRSGRYGKSLSISTILQDAK